MNWIRIRRQALTLTLLLTFAHILYYLYTTQQWTLLVSVVTALVGGEVVNLWWKGKTMSAEFLEKWSKSANKTWVALLLQVLLNLFGLHLQGWL